MNTTSHTSYPQYSNGEALIQCLAADDIGVKLSTVQTLLVLVSILVSEADEDKAESPEEATAWIGQRTIFELEATVQPLLKYSDRSVEKHEIKRLREDADRMLTLFQAYVDRLEPENRPICDDEAEERREPMRLHLRAQPAGQQEVVRAELAIRNEWYSPCWPFSELS